MQPLQPGLVRSLPDKAAHALSFLFLFAVMGFAVHASWHALSAHYTLPNKDDWRILDDLFSKPVVEWLLTDQNGHWVPLTLGLFYIDYTVLGGHMDLPVAGSVLFLVVGLGVLAAVFVSSGQARDPRTLAALGLAGFLFTWGAARYDLVWGLQSSVIMAAMWTLVSLATFGVWLERRRVSGDSSGPKLLLVSAIAALAATFSQGLGFSCWAGLLVAAVAARVPVRVLTLLAACALGAFVVYQSGIESPTGHGHIASYGRLMTRAPIDLASRAIAFIGSPLADTLSSLVGVRNADRNELARFCGAVGVALFVLPALSFISPRARLTRRHVLAIGLPTTAFVGGLMVALNRSFFPGSETHIRFATWSCLFWVGLVAAIPAQSPRRTWVGLTAVVAVFLLSGLTLPALSYARRDQGKRRDQLAVIRALHQLDIRWDPLAGGATIVSDPDRSYRLLERFRRDGTSVYDEPGANLPRSLLSDHATHVDTDRCAGGVTSTQRIFARDSAALLISGWAVDRQHDAPIERIVFTDVDGVIVGMGVSVVPSALPEEALVPDQDFSFAGFIRGNYAAGPYNVLGLLEEERVACKLGTVARSRNNPTRSD